MKRRILNDIESWNAKNKRKPLVLMGARQVGKTWLMEEFAKRAYPGDTVAVNFMEDVPLYAVGRIVEETGSRCLI